MSVYTLAAMFIVSCPASNAALPFTSYPSLQVDGSTCTCEEPQCGSPRDVIKRGSGWASKHGGWPETWRPQQSNSCMPPSPGKSVTFTANSTIPAGSYVTFVSGLSVVSVQGNINGKSTARSMQLDLFANLVSRYGHQCRCPVPGYGADLRVRNFPGREGDFDSRRHQVRTCCARGQPATSFDRLLDHEGVDQTEEILRSEAGRTAGDCCMAALS